MFGFLNVYKPKGMTSHDVVAIMRRITKIKQIGHTGTLDPFAEGVLPICIGKSTRLIEYLNDDKAYIGTIQFGKSTTTYDIEGDVVNISQKKVLLNDIEKTLPQFRGEIQQLPPVYSAIKVKGKKLYEYARNGEEVKIEPRNITITKLELLNFNEELQVADIYIECSKGTYIRSIANDLGEKVGCFGHLIKLVRTKAGKFEIDKTVNLDELENKENLQKYLINPLDYLEYPKYELSELEREKISHGMSLNIDCKDGKIVLVNQNCIAAIGIVNNKTLKVLKVFI